MVAEPKTTASNTVDYSVFLKKPIYGYARLTYFNTKIWQYAIIFVFIVGVAALVFPSQRMLVSHYNNKDMIEEALSILPDTEKGLSDNVALLLMSANLYQKAGRPDQAIKALELLLKKNPLHPEAFTELVALYKDNQNPLELIAVLKRKIKMYPEDVDSWRSLAELYEYLGHFHDHVDAVVQLIDFEKTLSPDKAFDGVFPESKSKIKIKDILNDPMIHMLGRELNRLVGLRIPEDRNPFIDELIRQLYALRLKLIRSIHSKGPPLFRDQDTAVIRMLEPYIRTGLIEEGNKFASLLDKELHNGTRNRRHLVKILQWSKQSHQAYEILVKMHQEDKKDVAILLEMANAARENQDLQNAISAFKEITRLRPDNYKFALTLADLYYDIGNSRRAFAWYEKVALKQGKCVPMVEKILEIAGATDSRPMVMNAAKIGRMLCPGNPDIMKTIGEMLLAVGAEQEAMNAYSDYLKLNPNDSNAAGQLANLYNWSNRSDKAYALFKKLAQSVDTGVATISKMMEAAAATGNPKTLREAAELAMFYRPDDTALKLKMAAWLAADGVYPDAINIYRGYLKKHPEDINVIQLLAELYQWTEQTDKETDLLAQASERHPDNFHLALSAAAAWLRAEKLERSIFYLQRASQINPEDMDVRKRLSTYYQWTEQTERLIAELEYLDAVDQIQETEKILLAQSYLEQKQGLKALKHLTPFEEQSPLPVKEGLMLASAYELTGQVDASTRIYKRIGKENVKDVDLLVEAGNQALWQNKPEIALSLFESALKSDPKNLVALKGSGQIYAWLDRSKKAISHLEAYNRIFPDDYEVRYQLGELYFSQGHKHNAFRHYKKAMALIRKQKRLTTDNRSVTSSAK